MGMVLRLIACIVALLLCTTCGEFNRGYYGFDSGHGIEYIFIADEPFDFAGPDGGDQELRATATDLLTNRTVYFYPGLGISLSPDYHDGTAFDSTVAYSRIGTYAAIIPGIQPRGGNTSYQGNAVYGVPADPGLLIFHFGHSITSEPQQPQIRYHFRMDEAEALVRGMKDWRGGYNDYAFSPEATTVEATLTGIGEGGQPWELSCRQNFRCLAITYAYE